jgi:predicted RNA-binding protein with EMAP domain
MGNIDALTVRVDNLEKSIQELKYESREDRKQFTQAIERLDGSLQELKENGIKLNMLLERTDEKLGYLNNKVEAIEKDIRKPSQENEEVKWYREMLGHTGKYLFYILILLLCVSLGLKLEDVFGILK